MRTWRGRAMAMGALVWVGGLLLLEPAHGYVLSIPRGPLTSARKSGLVSQPLAVKHQRMSKTRTWSASLNPWKLSAASYLLDPSQGGQMDLREEANQPAAATGDGDDAKRSSRGLIPPNAMQMLVESLSSEEAVRKYIWVAFLALAWQLRSFYGIILGTFVLSYLGGSVVRIATKYGNNLLTRLKLPKLPRRMWALGYILTVITALVTVSVISVPRVVGETNYMSLVIESDNPYVFVADGIRNFMGPEAMDKLEVFLLSITGEEGRNFASGVITAKGAADVGGAAGAAAAKGVASGMAGEAVWTGARASRFAKLLEFSLKGYVKSAFYLCRKLLSHSTSVIYKGILSLLFSFMIIWDLPKLAEGAKSLRYSALRVPYEVLAPKITAFGKLVGQSFEVQSMIALVNTVLTTLGLVFLKIPGYGFLSVLVLITSFIPVFGVFLSTFPMALVALSEYGVKSMIDVILMVIGIHAVEAYMLSPLIYSATVKLHPVFVLAALYVTEHVAGLQGVFLAVPVTMYVIKEIIRFQPPPAEDSGAQPRGEMAAA